MRAGWVLISGCLLAAAVLAADPEVRAPQTRAAIDQQLSALSQKQLDLAFAVRDQIQKNDTLWMNPQYTSPEIEKIRKRMDLLKKEMLELQMALRERVAQIPEARAELEKVEQWKGAHQAMAQQIEALKKQREQTP